MSPEEELLATEELILVEAIHSCLAAGRRRLAPCGCGCCRPAPAGLGYGCGSGADDSGCDSGVRCGRGRVQGCGSGSNPGTSSATVA